MRAVELVASRTLEVRELPEPPEPGPDEVLVRVRAVGICGSDMHWYLEGRIGAWTAVYPQILGHEPAGEVVATGRNVRDLEPGVPVACEPAILCGHCEPCLTGRPNNCVRSVFMGSPQMPGFFRDCVVLPAHNIVPIPSGMSFVEATLIEPVAVILHVLELVELPVGSSVAVLGAGPIGLLSSQVARIAGAGRVFVADRLPHRLRLARAMGADVAVDTRARSFLEAVMDDTRGRGVDLVLDAAGAVETINLAIAVARPGGTVALIGIPKAGEHAIDLHAAMSKELRLQAIKRSNRNAHAAMDLVAAGRIPSGLVTHHLPLEETARGFELLASYEDDVGKVVVEL